MGGMIAQTMALEEPERVLSLTSIMSSTGRKLVGWQHPSLIPTLLAPRGTSREAYIAGAKACVAATQKEAGCIYHDSHSSVNDPNRFVVVERWESREALDSHGAAPHMKVWRELSAPFKASPTQIEIITPADVIKR